MESPLTSRPSDCSEPVVAHSGPAHRPGRRIGESIRSAGVAGWATAGQLVSADPIQERPFASVVPAGRSTAPSGREEPVSREPGAPRAARGSFVSCVPGSVSAAGLRVGLIRSPMVMSISLSRARATPLMQHRDGPRWGGDRFTAVACLLPHYRRVYAPVARLAPHPRHASRDETPLPEPDPTPRHRAHCSRRLSLACSCWIATAVAVSASPYFSSSCPRSSTGSDATWTSSQTPSPRYTHSPSS